MRIDYFHEEGIETERHNEICEQINTAIKSARKRLVANIGHDSSVRRINVHYYADEMLGCLEFVGVARLQYSFANIEEFENIVYNVLEGIECSAGK